MTNVRTNCSYYQKFLKKNLSTLSTFPETIKKARIDKGFTVQEMADFIGVSHRAYTFYESGRSMPKHENLIKITNKLGLRVEQVLKLDSEQIVQTENVLREPQETYLEKRRKQKNNKAPFLVPMVPIKAQAGYVKAVDQEVFLDALEKYALPPGVNPQGAVWRYWEVEGDSMEPTFHTGDVILTSQVPPMDWENIRNFYLYVIVTSQTGNPNTTERVLFKRLYCKNPLEWVLISENEEGHPQQLLPAESVKEVWVYRRSIVNKAPPSRVFEIKV